ncbi:MAG: homoserine O-acetyltransferase [Chitinophagaceae bacterium]|nr:homoserine O-acetyltransferase [Chitinophagaceae bacterium]
MSYQTFTSKETFVLESGKSLPQLHLAYHTFGELNATKSNVVWVFHALTANSNPVEWWPGIVGDGCIINPQQHFIVCVNMPNSCYGSIGPLDVNPLTNEPYYHNFPLFTTRDMVRAYQLLKENLGIEKIYMGIGGSMGGQQLLEWAIEQPELFEYIVPIATNAQHSPWGIAFNKSQRMCIENDSTWKDKNANAGIQGMKTARSLALISYRHYQAYTETQTGVVDDNLPVDEQVFKAETYQQYQGQKLANRFNAFSYWFLTKAMDTHNVGRGRKSVIDALKLIQAKALVVSIKTDILFPIQEQEFLVAHIPNAELTIINSHYGHDGFLLEHEKITLLLRSFLKRDELIN